MLIISFCRLQLLSFRANALIHFAFKTLGADGGPVISCYFLRHCAEGGRGRHQDREKSTLTAALSAAVALWREGFWRPGPGRRLRSVYFWALLNGVVTPVRHGFQRHQTSARASVAWRCLRMLMRSCSRLAKCLKKTGITTWSHAIAN